LTAPSELPERPAAALTPEVSEALGAVYRVLAQLPVDERIAFALRHVDGMQLTDVAASTRVSLATAKRRISRAQGRFVGLAQAEPSLSCWLGERVRAK
jgi:RNA polymerase sigma-70 factor (ECF subfamily)